MSWITKNEILFPDNENGIYLYEYPMINGIKQYVQVRGADRKNPLILFIHGGPGGSLAGICHILQAGWEEEFTVANWDQRNTCKTYFANKDRAEEISRTGTLDDYVRDIDEVIAYLHTVYEFEKLILIGFSWGSVIGSEYAKRHPEKLLCYIGVGQHINYRDGVMTTCRKMLDIASIKSSDKQKIMNIIADLPQKPLWDKALMKCMRYYSPLTFKYIAKHARRLPLGKILNSPFMNFREKKAALLPDQSLLSKTFETMLTFEFRNNLCFDIPVLFIFGEEETACPSELLAECFEELSAPIKRMIIIPNASHSCFFDQPDIFYNTLISFLNDIMTAAGASTKKFN